MNCRHFGQLLDQYLDGDLAGTMKLEFEAHLMDCEHCGHLLGTMQAMGQIIAAPAPDEPKLSSDFADRVMAGLATQRTTTVKFHRRLAQLSAAAAIALLVTGTLVFSSGRVGALKNFAGKQVAALPQLVGQTTHKETLLASANVRPTASAAQPDLNLWLAGTLEKAGSSLWELKELRNSTLDQVRQGVLSSLTGGPTRTEGNAVPTQVNMPVQPVQTTGASEATEVSTAGYELL